MPVPAPGQAVPPVGTDLAGQIDEWLRQPALSTLLGLFGAPAPSAGLDAVAEWTSTHWNFRAGKERNFLDPELIDPDASSLVLRLAPELGLVTPERPSRPEYDHVLVLGGLVRACVWRTEYAKHLLETGAAARNVTAVTGRRPLLGDEPELLTAFGYPELLDEAAVMREAMTRAFTPSGFTPVSGSSPETAANSQWSVEDGKATTDPSVHFVMAPSSEPDIRRANTPDSYRFWAEEVAKLGANDTVLLVTSQIYLPFQHSDAVRMLGLPYGCTVETVGIDHSVISDRGVAQVFSGVNYLQEINSTLRSLRLLRDALTE